MPDIDWKMLRAKAHEVMGRAYAPYSGFPVGAAGLTVDGRMVLGCNVENVSHGLGLCAECVLVGNLIAQGGGRLRAVAVCDSRGHVLTPCGRCRQVLLEHGGPDLEVDAQGGPRRLSALLPDAFGPDDLAAVRENEDRRA
ncbi:cytidine deaminase [Rhodococcus rhodochrous J3]|uniref:Cytidine deaminase n=2 Tax=Rhodococcus rhodochrous TaxID=1829 RepID=A0AA46WSV7_RHORH|nr:MULTISPECIES: cytidine deaminase [Rhodococcus]AYA27229.1 cytidine deaminase [Rhodococcus rhodochrous]MBF4479667.1 cytidine deaminase [Rhodococcus rhodochrous]MCD2096820.1 cytidine deaminase [Rhodococcus rhodochrous]MCD2121649.1 cytidine deaminase [Rhodococcus rhodochrous]MCQ4133427.1 cytidine deaminase [Rhodococcus rhodochrous]